MDVRLSVICLVLLTLQDADACVIDAENKICTATEGGNITVKCSFTFSGRKRIFCRDGCEDGKILVETEKTSDQSGRYSIEYDSRSVLKSALLYVSIRNLTQSDSGTYRCGLFSTYFLFPSSQDFEIRVEEASISSQPNRTTSPPLPPPPPPSSQSPGSTSGSSTASSALAETNRQPQLPADSPGVLLYVGLTLAGVFVLFLVALLIFYKKRARSAKDPPSPSFCSPSCTNTPPAEADVPQANRMYEEIRQDRRSRSPPVEISTVYAYAKYSQPEGEESSEYSLVTAPAPQPRTEDDSGKLTYSLVDFARRAAVPLHGAPCGGPDQVVYSAPRVEASSDGSHAADTSPPLYSTLTLQ